MRTPSRIAVPLAAAALISASGVLHAVQTGAWGREKLMASAAVRLQSVPLDVKNWHAKSLEFDPGQIKVAQAAGAISRIYAANDGQSSVNVMMLCGPSGPIAVHPPTVCFTAAGYRQVTDQHRVEVKDSNGRAIGSFWCADFEWQGASGSISRIRTYWGWSSDGTWRAPDYPRYQFAGSPVLNKLYVIHSVGQSDTGGEVIEGFLRDFLPSVNQTLFPVEV